MPNPQPGQEQRMVTDAMVSAARRAVPTVALARATNDEIATIYAAMHAARPAADPGEYGELVAWLRRDANRQDGTDVSIISTNAMRNAADRLETQAATIARLREGLEAIGSGEAFREQRFAEDDDAEYFLRAQRHVQQLATAALSPNPTSP